MRRSSVVVGALYLVLIAAIGLSADVKSRQKTQIKFEGMLGKMAGMFGGKAMKEGVINTVAISGDRQMTINDQSGELIDLAAEKVYKIDFKGKSYKVQTFAEIRKEWEEAQAKMKEQAGTSKEQGGEAQYEVDFSIDKSGERKTINGYDCQLFVMTIAMHQKGKKLEDGGGLVMTSDMWMGPKIPAMQEQMAFQQRYLKKLFGTDAETMARDLAQAMAMYPQMKTGMERMKKEGAKLDGTAILTTMKMESVMSPDQASARADQQKSSGGVGSIAGLGGMFGKKKKTDDTPKEGQPAAGGASNRATILTTSTELLGVETAVAAADVELPAGFKQK
jgi:hypothetical protein